MRSLAELYNEHEGKVSDKWALYLREYDRLFLPYRESSISLLEIGTQNGGGAGNLEPIFCKCEETSGLRHQSSLW